MMRVLPGQGVGRSTSRFIPLLLLSATMAFQQQQTQTQSRPSSNFRKPDEGAFPPTGAKLISGSTEFAVNLFKQLSKAGENVFFSPTSISIAMAMTYLGSGSSTAEEMKQVLGFANVGDDHVHDCMADLQKSLLQTDGNYTLHLANRLYGQRDYPFLTKFLENAKKHYDAELMNVHFGDDATRLAINKWVEDQTNRKIENLLAEPLDPLTRLVLVNAIYFKGDWMAKFDANKTKKAAFHLTNGDSVQVDLMHIKRKFNVVQMRELDTMVLELPYKGDTLSMAILLPNKQDGLPALEAALTAEHLANLSLGKPGNMDIMVWLPRFRLEQSASLGETLSKMGMPEAFDEKKADLSGMDGTRNLFVSKVLHKAFIEVNEEGSEAAAATAAIVMMRSMPRNIEFRADHPFIFLIRDNVSKALLFMGKFEKPTAAGGKDEL